MRQTRLGITALLMVAAAAAPVVWSFQLPKPSTVQGMAGRGAAAMPKPPRSGREFPVSFSDVARRAGLLSPQISGGVAAKKYIVETMGQGVAFIDFNSDAWPDVFLVNGSQFGTAAPPPPNRLYRNNRDGTFTEVTREARLGARTGWGQSVAVADYDNDGHSDLFVTYWGQNALYHNNGDGTFAEVAVRAGVAGDARRWHSGAAFFDYDRDGRLDLFVANYLDFDLRHAPLPGANPGCTWLGLPVLCGPRGLPFSSNLLYRNQGDGTFTDVSAESGIGAKQNTYGLGALAADFDGDGWQDLYLACDSTRSLFYRNNGNGTFSERAVFTGLAYDDNGLEQAGMGLALGDYNGDGLLDIAKTNFVDDYPNLYRNLGKGGYSDGTLAAGLGVNPQFVLWSAIFADFDNDTWPDLFFSAGHIFPEVDRLKTAQRFRNPRLLYRNLGNGRFEDVSDRSGPGILAEHSSRGAEAGDFNNDGNLDLLIMNMNEPPSLLKNESRGGGGGNSWLKVELQGVRSNRDGIGALVRVTTGGRTQVQARLSQSGFYSSADKRLHFGLGRSAAGGDAAVEVVWPGGLTERWSGIKANTVFLAVEATGKSAAR